MPSLAVSLARGLRVSCPSVRRAPRPHCRRPRYITHSLLAIPMSFKVEVGWGAGTKHDPRSCTHSKSPDIIASIQPAALQSHRPANPADPPDDSHRNDSDKALLQRSNASFLVASLASTRGEARFSSGMK